MRMNENTIICGDKVILVPYREEHVQTYHEWMKSPELLELTASEPLSLEEEYDMQRKWREDNDKLTFILLARPDDLPASSHPLLTPADLAQCKMVGDVNMFLPDGPAEDVECEIMIAEPSFRRRGGAFEALTLFLTYSINSPLSIKPANMIVRIGATNTPSIELFKRLGFDLVKDVNVFGEVELRWGGKNEVSDTEALAQWPESKIAGRVGVYSDSA